MIDQLPSPVTINCAIGCVFQQYNISNYHQQFDKFRFDLLRRKSFQRSASHSVIHKSQRVQTTTPIIKYGVHRSSALVKATISLMENYSEDSFACVIAAGKCSKSSPASLPFGCMDAIGTVSNNFFECWPRKPPDKLVVYSDGDGDRDTDRFRGRHKHHCLRSPGVIVS